MPLGQPGRSSEPLYVIPMALALALAAFAGGALGLVWDKLAGAAKPAATAGASNSPR